ASGEAVPTIVRPQALDPRAMATIQRFTTWSSYTLGATEKTRHARIVNPPLIDAMTERDIEAVLAIDLESFHRTDIGAADADGPHKARERQLREELVRTWARLRVARGLGLDAAGASSAAGAREVLGYVLFWHVADEVHLLNVAVA